VTGERRPVLPRIGIAALNILLPGLGLLRLGRSRAAAFFCAATLLLWIASTLGFGLMPELGFGAWLTLAMVVAGGTLALIITSIALSWRFSRVREPRGRWAKWYAIAAIGLGALVATQLSGLGPERRYKSYYLPSEGMAPTLQKNDRFIAFLGRTDPARGDIIVFPIGAVDYVKRVAALPGDRIAMVGGQVVLNGQAIAQTPVGSGTVHVGGEQLQARRLRERFPGEPADHEIYDTGATGFDEMAELRVPAGRVFVLGDNRDLSADSRVPREQMGVALLPLAEIRGKALYHSIWSSRKAGTRISFGRDAKIAGLVRWQPK
jgi:signal peptidase I